MFTKQEIWQLSDDEAKKLAHAVKNVLKHHQINISPAALAYVQLVGVGAAVYGPRIGMLALMRKMQRQQEQQAAEMAAANGATSLAVLDPTTPMQ